jgi:sortase A
VQWWKLVGVVGRTMMRAGAVLLLFVIYQLWGTGLLTARDQDRLRSSFDARLAEVAPTDPTDDDTDAAPGDELDGEVFTAPVDLVAPEPGQPIARIDIPAIGSDFIMVQGVDLRWLQSGPGHFPQTPLPGQPGNAAVAGHRTTWLAPFNRIDELEPGEPIIVTTLQGRFVYRVDAHPTDDGGTTGHVIVGPDDISILDQTDVDRLTLMACHPKFSSAQRIVVTATLSTEAAAPTPLPVVTDGVTTDASVDTLAGGDPDAWPGAIALSILTGGLWFGTWYLARRWKKWPAYAIGTPIVLLSMFVAFTEIVRLLPAAY